jgi:hypothetical protein
MPLNNNLFGVYKSLKVSGVTYVAESATRKVEMEVDAKNYVQGSPKSRVLNIGGTKESISITAPILVGGGQSVDGRSLANTKISEILDPNNASLPVLESATYKVSPEGASVTINLKSDGDPGSNTDTTPRPFEVSGREIEELKPNSAGGPSRVARFYDFRVQIGNRKYFIMEATLNVNASVTEAYFLVPNDPAITDAVTQARITQTIGGNIAAGYQFPFLGISGIKISGQGKAAVVLKDVPGTANYGDYYFFDYDTEGGTFDESLNLGLGRGQSDITFQRPGVAVYEAQTFRLEIYDPIGAEWTNLLPASIDLSKTVVNSSNFSVSTGVLTVDFDFFCWVQ